jgi:vibriolysin
VHTASGVFNKAFYLLANKLLANKIGIRIAYQIMLRANTHYWTPTTDFTSAAYAVLHATKDLRLNTITVRTVFNQVGVSTNTCRL